MYLTPEFWSRPFPSARVGCSYPQVSRPFTCSLPSFRRPLPIDSLLRVLASPLRSSSQSLTQIHAAPSQPSFSVKAGFPTPQNSVSFLPLRPVYRSTPVYTGSTSTNERLPPLPFSIFDVFAILCIKPPQNRPPSPSSVTTYTPHIIYTTC